MALDLKAPEKVILKPLITVLGVGGAGGNAVNNMIAAKLQGAKFVVANTDAQALSNSLCESRIQLGVRSTKGLGAGASPEVGKEAAEESESEIRSYLEGSNMVFVTAGMGGGTGTGGAPVIAKIARELGILTVGVVTKPFLFEGGRRMKLAEAGLLDLQKHVDTLIIIPNQNLFSIANENTTFEDAFKMADEVLHAGVRSVTDLSTMPGLINLDFADIKSVMSEMGKAMMGTGEAEGDDRAIRAAEIAIANPLLDHSSMCGARGVLINITGGKDMTLYEVDSAANRIREEVGDSDANIIFGSTFNPDMKGVIRVSVVATGIDAKARPANKESVTGVEERRLNNGIRESSDFQELPPEFDEYAQMNAAEAHIANENSEGYSDDLFSAERANSYKQPNSFADYVAQNVAVVPQKKPKKSFLKRIWNSLKSDDNSNDNYQATPSIPTNKPGYAPEDSIAQNSNANTSSENRPLNSLQEMPNLMRRK